LGGHALAFYSFLAFYICRFKLRSLFLAFYAAAFYFLFTDFVRPSVRPSVLPSLFGQADVRTRTHDPVKGRNEIVRAAWFWPFFRFCRLKFILTSSFPPFPSTSSQIVHDGLPPPFLPPPFLPSYFLFSVSLISPSSLLLPPSLPIASPHAFVVFH
jgi:hypothetical protein